VTHDFVKCFAAHSSKMPSELRKAILRSPYSDRALKHAESILSQNPLFKSLAGTTQAIDLIGGGVKTYVPERYDHRFFDILISVVVAMLSRKMLSPL
jgi:hypothetical protein